MKLSPIIIETMIFVYCSGERHPNENSIIIKDAFNYLIKNDLIIKNDDRCSGYQTTSKGNAWIDMICNTPFPVKTWTDPRDFFKKEKIEEEKIEELIRFG